MNKKDLIKKKLNNIKAKINIKDRNEEYKKSMIAINKHFYKREYDEVDKILDNLITRPKFIKKNKKTKYQNNNNRVNSVGLESELFASTDVGNVYRVYATFDDPKDELVAIYGTDVDPMTLSVTTSFYQNAFGSNFGSTINPAFFGPFPLLEYDSWFTIGLSPGTTSVGMESYLKDFNSGQGFTINTFIGGSIFVIPGMNTTSVAGDDRRVLIGQFTTDGIVELTVNIQWDDINGNTFNSNGLYISFPSCHNSKDTVTIETCDSFDWDEVTYDSTGLYTNVYSNVNGCDSTVTLDLTINNTTTSTVTIGACDSFDWDGMTYDSTGLYTNVYSNVNGCDSTVTLDLTINNTTTSTITIGACDSFDWDGMTYDSTGLYTNVYSNVNGCDSTVTLDLTINNCDCIEDFDGDEMVGISDIEFLLSKFGTTCTESECPADLDNDGLVGVSDLLSLLSVFGSSC
jgi:hypothetical protein